MKKIIALFLVVISLFLIVSCNNSQSDNSQSNNQGNIDEGNNNSGISSIDKETLEIERNHYAIIEKGLDKLADNLKNPAKI